MDIITRLAIQRYLTSFYRILVVLSRPIPKLGGKDIQQLTSAPSLLAERVVREVIGRDPTQAVLEIIRSRPWVTRCDCNLGWWGEWFIGRPGSKGVNLRYGQSHAGAEGATTARQKGQHSR